MKTDPDRSNEAWLQARRRRKQQLVAAVIKISHCANPRAPSPVKPVDTPKQDERTAAEAAIDRTVRECIAEIGHHPGEVALLRAVKAKLPDRNVPRSMFRQALVRTGHKLPNGRRRIFV
jgi:hypothetical protein